MDGAVAQKKVYSGYGKAAQFIGQDYQLFRPEDPLEPINQFYGPVSTIKAAFNQDDTFSKPNKYGNAQWRGIFDGNQTQVGDYLVGPSTFFIAGMQHILPILCIECNRTISILRPTQPTGAGAVGYGGDVADDETPLMQGWPASILQGTKGEKNPTGLPGDERLPWWIILLPAWPDIIIQTSDVITDDLGRRYIVSSPELTDFGWRIVAGFQGA